MPNSVELLCPPGVQFFIAPNSVNFSSRTRSRTCSVLSIGIAAKYSLFAVRVRTYLILFSFVGAPCRELLFLFYSLELSVQVSRSRVPHSLFFRYLPLKFFFARVLSFVQFCCRQRKFFFSLTSALFEPQCLILVTRLVQFSSRDRALVHSTLRMASALASLNRFFGLFCSILLHPTSFLSSFVARKKTVKDIPAGQVSENVQSVGFQLSWIHTH